LLVCGSHFAVITGRPSDGKFGDRAPLTRLRHSIDSFLRSVTVHDGMIVHPLEEGVVSDILFQSEAFFLDRLVVSSPRFCEYLVKINLCH
jgi:hypothetical protein